jgi:hypothetical protein
VSGGRPPASGGDLPAVFPDWSPYRDLDSAARAYLRDPEIALESLSGVLGDATVVGFTLERFVTEVNGVWQEIAVSDGFRLILWHGEDLPTDDGSPLAMTSSVRVVPLSSVTEVGCRQRLTRSLSGEFRVDGVDVYLLLGSLDESGSGIGVGDEHQAWAVRHDALRFSKTLDDGGRGQIRRLEEFARLIGSLIGRPAVQPRQP